MSCRECESIEAAPTRIEYVVEETEVLPLCADCRDEYRAGEFVKEVSPVEEESD